MRFRHLSKRMSETLLPLFIVSTVFEVLFIGEYIGDGIIRIAMNFVAYLFFIVWFITTLIKSVRQFRHRKTYFIVNGILVLLITVLSTVMAYFNLDPFYYFLFSPFSFIKLAGFSKLLLSNTVCLAPIIISYLVVPLTLKRIHRRHHHHHHHSEPVNTNNFITKT